LQPRTEAQVVGLFLMSFCAVLPAALAEGCGLHQTSTLYNYFDLQY
jgi:hypothetical protein